MDPKTDPASEDYKQVRAVIDRAIHDLSAFGAEVVLQPRVGAAASREPGVRGSPESE